MENKNYSVMFKKINYDSKEGYFFLKPYKIEETDNIDFKYEILVSKITGENTFINNSKLWYSKEKNLYGYNISLNNLKKQYKNIKTEILKDVYFNDVNLLIYICIKDDFEGKFNIVTTNKEMLEDIIIDDTMNCYYLQTSSENDKEMQLFMDESKVDKLINLLKNKENEVVIDFFENLKQDMEEFNDTLDGFFSEEIIRAIDEEDLEEAKDVVKVEMVDKSTLDGEIEELNNLVGLENVKDKIKELINYLKYVNKVKEYVPLDKINLHMVLTGNPGTGKTTVARIISKLMYLLGFAKTNKFTEATPKDLIAEYVGQTGPKASAFIKKNKGGVIFLDEAYNLASDDENVSFGQDALVEILKEMEKNETIFIFAGYKKEMESFIKSNSGLTSRVGYYMEFKDYGKQELLEIFKRKMAKHKLTVEDEAYEVLDSVLDDVINKENFGNGRFIDKLFDKIIVEHANNTVDSNDLTELTTIKACDINELSIKETLYKEKTKMLGFQKTK